MLHRSGRSEACEVPAAVCCAVVQSPLEEVLFLPGMSNKRWSTPEAATYILLFLFMEV